MGLAALGMVLIGVAVAARYSDGPIGPFPGGPLRSGAVVLDPNVDWSTLTSRREIELQLVDPPRSRTTWILVHEGQAFVPCGFPNLSLWKQWPHQVLRDGRTVVRIDGRRYERHAVRITDPELHADLSAGLTEKYESTPGFTPTPESVWFFRLDPRTAASR
jgi:hypothetical protein